MTRAERIKERYKYYRSLGYSSKEATKLKHRNNGELVEKIKKSKLKTDEKKNLLTAFLTDKVSNPARAARMGAGKIKDELKKQKRNYIKWEQDTWHAMPGISYRYLIEYKTRDVNSGEIQVYMGGTISYKQITHRDAIDRLKDQVQAQISQKYSYYQLFAEKERVIWSSFKVVRKFKMDYEVK
jgi:hypothetical protein